MERPINSGTESPEGIPQRNWLVERVRGMLHQLKQRLTSGAPVRGEHASMDEEAELFGEQPKGVGEHASMDEEAELFRNEEGSTTLGN